MNFFENLKAGDKIGIIPATSYSNERPWDIHLVTRVTKTLIIVDDRRFKRANGDEQCGRSQSPRYFKATLAPTNLAIAHNAKIAKITAKKKLVHRAENVNFESLTVEQLTKILEIAAKV